MKILSVLIIALIYYLGHELWKLQREVRIQGYKNREVSQGLEFMKWYDFRRLEESTGESTSKELVGYSFITGMIYKEDS